MAKPSRSRLVIRHKATECVGCCLCAETVPQYFEMDEHGLAVLQAARDDGVFRRASALTLDQEQLETAVEGCPVDIIRVSSS